MQNVIHARCATRQHTAYLLMFRLLALAQKLGRTIICTPSLLITPSLIDPSHSITEAWGYQSQLELWMHKTGKADLLPAVDPTRANTLEHSSQRSFTGSTLSLV